MAATMGIPTLIQEQNSYAGVTNKLLAKQAKKICVAYEGMERFFPQEKIILTGNPVRQTLVSEQVSRKDAAKHFDLDPNRKTVLIIGGSLGARTLNETMIANLNMIQAHPEVQFIWQVGKIYIDQVKEALRAYSGELVCNSHIVTMPNLYVNDFIKHMEYAYGIADLVVSRAGAGSISEFCLLGKPVILVPSPNVAEDHQTQNALALVRRDAALYVKDVEAKEQLVELAIETVKDNDKLQALNRNILEMALPDSAEIIAKEVLRLADEKEA
jgi:UDP-N-acetylglucosamine--N-acetylmuramyl-(pentapeptide) pyrophosphoryl-undecaprenol N-acetylglucosamine transferase